MATVRCPGDPATKDRPAHPCGREYEEVERTADHVKLTADRMPDLCCQRNLSNGHALLGVWNIQGK